MRVDFNENDVFGSENNAAHFTFESSIDMAVSKLQPNSPVDFKMTFTQRIKVDFEVRNGNMVHLFIKDWRLLNPSPNDVLINRIGLSENGITQLQSQL